MRYGYTLTPSTLGIQSLGAETQYFLAQREIQLPAVPSTAKARVGHGVIG